MTRLLLIGVVLVLVLSACAFEVVQTAPGTYRVGLLWPTVVSTAAPSLTATPTARPSSTPTVTPVPVSPTPTQETLLTPAVTVTPRPTIPPPDELRCMAGAMVILNVRADRTTTSAIVRKLAAGERVEVLELYVRYPEGSARREEWGRIADGWIALWYGGTELARLDDSEGCWSIPIAYASAWGVWAGPGAQLDALLALGAQLRAANVTPAVTLYGVDAYARPLTDAGFIVLLRPWLPDCPNMLLGPAASARERVDLAVAKTAGLPYAWLVLSNECVWPSTGYAATWIREVIAYAAKRGVHAVVPVVWATGHPELADVGQLAAAYAGAPIRVAWGLNVYPFTRGVDLSARGGSNEYTVWRWRLYRHQLPKNTPLIVTEAARGDRTRHPFSTLYGPRGRTTTRQVRCSYRWSTFSTLYGPRGRTTPLKPCAAAQGQTFSTLYGPRGRTTRRCLLFNSSPKCFQYPLRAKGKNDTAEATLPYAAIAFQYPLRAKGKNDSAWA